MFTIFVLATIVEDFVSLIWFIIKQHIALNH